MRGQLLQKNDGKQKNRTPSAFKRKAGSFFSALLALAIMV